ncbi:hypothetical protein ACHAWT_009757 [Skeletonema menzelii]
MYSLVLNALSNNNLRHRRRLPLTHPLCSICSESTNTTTTTTNQNGPSIDKSRRSKGRPHKRNSFQGSYDINRLTAAHPALHPHIIIQAHSGRQTVNWSNPESVRVLNTALLVADYGIHPQYADLLPMGALFPPVPGRADYVHHMADLLQRSNNDGNIPLGRQVVGVDIGTGASCIYPILATSIYGWRMIASEIDPTSIRSARDIVTANALEELIDVRTQERSSRIFDGVLHQGEVVDFTMCNPPFYTSKGAFQAENARKLRGLSSGMSNNFGGNDNELWCNGGEVSFVKNMIRESELYQDKCLWFTSLVSRKDNLPKIESIMNIKGKSRRKSGRRHMSIGSGHKSSTIIMWSFLDEKQRQEWGARRWS